MKYPCGRSFFQGLSCQAGKLFIRITAVHSSFKDDKRHLFKGLYVENSTVWEKANSAPVFYFDFKVLNKESYKEMLYFMACDYIDSYCGETKLSRGAKHYLNSENFDNSAGLLHLSESVYRATGKRSYIFIDEF